MCRPFVGSGPVKNLAELVSEPTVCVRRLFCFVRQSAIAVTVQVTRSRPLLEHFTEQKLSNNHPPPSRAEVKERVELYLYSLGFYGLL